MFNPVVLIGKVIFLTIFFVQSICLPTKTDLVASVGDVPYMMILDNPLLTSIFGMFVSTVPVN